MDRIEQFRILKEIQSLQLTKNQLLTEIEAENQRIEKLKAEMSRKLVRSEQIQSKLKEISLEATKLENELVKTQQSIETKGTQASELTTEQQIAVHQKDIENLESQLMSLESSLFKQLEIEEKLMIELEELEEFLGGIDEGIAEVQKIVTDNVHAREKEIDDIKNRYKNLKSQLSDEFVRAIEKLLKQKHSKSMFTILNNQNCEYCGMEVNRVELSEIDIKLAIKHCSGCKRLILPHSAYA